MLRASRSGSVVPPWHGRTTCGWSCLQPHEGGTRPGESGRRLDVRPGVLGGISGEHEAQLGNPERQVIVGVPGSVNEHEREIAAADRHACVPDREIGWRQDEASKRPGWSLGTLRRERAGAVLAASRSAQRSMADDRSTERRARNGEHLVPPGVVVVGVRVDDEEPPACSCRRLCSASCRASAGVLCVSTTTSQRVVVDDEGVDLVPAAKSPDARVERERRLDDDVEQSLTASGAYRADADTVLQLRSDAEISHGLCSLAGPDDALDVVGGEHLELGRVVAGAR